MERPLVAFSLTGTLISPAAWEKAHDQWFKKMADELGDKEILQWADRDDYFGGVDEIMLRRMMDAPEDQRRQIARQEFFALVVEDLSESDKLEDVSEWVRELSTRARIGIITTNSPEIAHKALTIAGLSDVVEVIETSHLAEPDDKLAVFSRFIRKVGKLNLYVGSSREDVRTFCQQEGISYVAREENESLDELRVAVERELRTA